MMFALALALLASTSVGSSTNPPAITRSNDDPPIQLWLSSDKSFVRGQRAGVYIRATQDGYLVVLRADAEGRVRVLFPLDPTSDAAVRGDRKFEVEGPDGHEAFTVDEGDGTGVVLAAWSESPFTFDGLVQGDQWDDHALGTQQSGGDREAALVEIVQGMAGENHFDYAVATYTVRSVTAYDGGSQNDRPSNEGPYYGGPYYGPWFGPAYGGLSVGLGFGHGWRYGRVGYGGFCDGFYWSPWGCGPFYDPFYPPLVYGSYRPFGGARFGGFHGSSFNGHNRGPYGFRNRTSWSGAQPRLRIPAGGSRVSGTNRSFVRERTGTRSFAPGSRSFSDGRYARPSFAPRGERAGGSGPAARSAPSAGSDRGGWNSARRAPSGGSNRGGWSSVAPRSSGPGYSRGGGGGGGRREGGGGGGGGGGDRRH